MYGDVTSVFRAAILARKMTGICLVLPTARFSGVSAGEGCMLFTGVLQAHIIL